MEIIEHIEYLLMDNDCVVVPDFGAFICQNVPATCVDGTFCPPSRKVSFNGALTHNDALLANALMSDSGCSYNAAVEMIAADVKAIKDKLIENQHIEFGSLGSFSYSETGCLVFEPGEASTVVNMMNFGLPTFTVENAQPAEEETEVQSGFVHFRKNVIRVAASIAVIIVMALTLTTPISVDSYPDKAAVATITAVNPVKREVKTVAKPQSADQKVAATVEVAKPEAHRTKYSVVIASLRSYEQAWQFVEASPEKGLTIIDAPRGSSVYKVALASGETREEMDAYVKENGVAEKYPDVWVCRN